MARKALYRIEVKTLSATKEGVFIRLIGTLGTSMELHLTPYNTKTNEYGHTIISGWKPLNVGTATFDHEIDYIGDIYEIELASEADWRCDWLKITNPDPVNPSKLSDVVSVFKEIEWVMPINGKAVNRSFTVSSGLKPIEIAEETLPSDYILSTEYGVYYYVPANQSYTVKVQNTTTRTVKKTVTKSRTTTATFEIGASFDTNDAVAKVFQLHANYTRKDTEVNKDTTETIDTYVNKTTETTEWTLKNTNSKYCRCFAARYKPVKTRQSISLGQIVIISEVDYGREFVDFVEVRDPNVPGEPQFLTNVSFTGVKSEKPEGHWEDNETHFTRSNGQNSLIRYNTFYVTESELEKYKGKFITNMLLVKSATPLTWRSKVFRDKKGIKATYLPLYGNRNQSGDGLYYSLCCTFDSQYTPLTKFEIVTREQYQANKAYSNGQYEPVRVADIGTNADLMDGQGSGLLLFVQRAALNKWKQYNKEPFDSLHSGVRSITELLIGNYPEYADARRVPEGYELVNLNLNQGVGGNYIYIRLKKEYEVDWMDSGREPITNLLLVQTDEEPDWNKAILKDGNGKEALYIRNESDLNKGAGGKHIYLCWTTDTDYDPLSQISAATDKSEVPEWWEYVTWAGTKEKGNVNSGIQGTRVYLLQAHHER